MNALLVLLGPTGVGKTDLSLQLAKKYNSPIISADSRQVYKDLVIGTAAPTPEQRTQAEHHLVGTLDLPDYYSAALFETDVMALLDKLFRHHRILLMAGGSMMYIDAICNGIDDIPTVPPGIRCAVRRQYEQEGLAPLLEELKQSDAVHYNEVDRKNHQRVIHVVEICRTTDRPYSSFRTHRIKERPFGIIKIGLARPREELYERINRRVDQMMADGMLDEARKVYPCRHLNALNTVGYKELFCHLDGDWTLAQAVEKIKRNTRIYARKQITWFKRDQSIAWFHPDEKQALIAFIEKKIAAL